MIHIALKQKQKPKTAKKDRQAKHKGTSKDQDYFCACCGEQYQDPPIEDWIYSMTWMWRVLSRGLHNRRRDPVTFVNEIWSIDSCHVNSL